MLIRQIVCVGVLSLRAGSQFFVNMNSRRITATKIYVDISQCFGMGYAKLRI